MTLHTGFKMRLAAILAVVLVAAACGDSPAESDETTTTTTIAALPEETTTTTAVPVETTTTTLATLEATTTTAAPLQGTDAGAAALSQAIDQTAELSSARYEGEISMTGLVDPTQALPIDEFTMAFSGAYSADGSFSMLMDLSSLADLAGEELGGFGDLFGAMELRVIDGVGYMSMPLLTMFTGFEWVEFPEEESGDVTEGFTAGGANPTNPADFLSAMRDADAEVREVGRELVRDVETTHYTAVIDVRKLMEDATPEERAEIEAQIGATGLEKLPFDVWIGDDGILRRYQFAIDGSDVEAQPGEGEFESMQIVMEMFDIGAEVVIEKPPADAIAPEDAFGDLLGFADAFGDLDG